MGGASAEIGPATERVLLECAWFEPTAIARTGNRLGLHSEARTRFERGVDPETADRAVARFCALLRTVPGGESLRRGPTVDVRDPRLPRGQTIRLRTARVNAILGIRLESAEIAARLAPLGFHSVPVDEGFDVTVPTWRLEVAREIDLIEEVARMWGYRRIPRTVPAGAVRRTGGLTARQRERRRIRQVLTGAGLDEAWTTTFLGPGDLERAGLVPDAVEVANPLDRSESLLRTSLRPGLLKALRFNVDRQLDDLALFEIGRVFAPPSGGRIVPDESELLGAILLPPSAANSAAADSEAVVSAVRIWQWLHAALRLESPSLEAASIPGLHPGRSARLMGAGEVLGEVGEVDPDAVSAYGLSGRVGWLGLSLDALEAAPRRPKLAHDVSRFPASDVDLAFVVPDDVPAARVAAALRRIGDEGIEEVSLFDVYRGERLGAGRRSLAFRVRVRAADHTLSDTELDDLRARLIAGAEATGVTLRS
jgi:phenylalanyl-tRNA synthetase beta chain